MFQENKSFGASAICIHPLMYGKPCPEQIELIFYAAELFWMTTELIIYVAELFRMTIELIFYIAELLWIRIEEIFYTTELPRQLRKLIA